MNDEAKTREQLLAEIKRLRSEIDRYNASEIEHKRTEEALGESEEKYRALFESLQDVFYRTDTEGNIILTSPSIVQLLGYTQDEANGLNMGKDIFAQPEQWKELVRFIEESRYLDEFEVLLKRCDGSVVWGSTTSQWYTDKKGRILGIEGIIRDINERKQTEEALRESEERFRKVFEEAPIGMGFVDLESSRFVKVNRALCQMLGYTEQELVGLTISDISHPEDILENTRLFRQALERQPAAFHMEKRYFKKNGEIMWANLITTIIRDGKGVPLYRLGMIEDITEHKRAEEALRESEGQLKELNASKDTFFSIIAHDLRGPLSSLHDLTQLIEENLDNYSPEELKDMISLQKMSAETLYKLLENLLTWSRFQRGMMTYQPQQIGIKWLVARNIELLALHAEQKQIALNNLIQEEINVHADFNMVDTVVRNLISNAVKFTHIGGTVEVSTWQNEREVEVSVSDTGIGIDEEDLPKLFRIDVRYKREGTGHEEGTGLGLILCKEFIEKHGGRIWVESQVGKGTTFRFTLPF